MMRPFTRVDVALWARPAAADAGGQSDRRTPAASLASAQRPVRAIGATSTVETTPAGELVYASGKGILN
jgi:hypothetical protein